MGFLGGRVSDPIVGANRRLRVVLAAALLVLAALATLYRSLLEPSLGWRFVPGPGGTVLAHATRPGLPELAGVRLLEGGGLRVPLPPTLVIESGGMLNTFAEQDSFFDGHELLWQVLQAGSVRIQHAAGVTVAQAQSRSPAELGLRFWFPWLVALLSASVGLGIWIYQPARGATRCYLVASLGYAFGMLCTASWGSRLLTQPPTGWSELHALSHLASFMVGGGLCALLWSNPRRLGGPWLPWVLALLVILCVAAEQWQWLDAITVAFRLPLVLLNALLAVLFGLQWRATRGDPVQRAQLKWFGLLLLVSLSSAFVAYAFGAAGHVVQVPQNYGLAVVALLFVGLVPLVTRVGLFQLEAWWPRAWLWFLGGLLVLALDAALVASLRWSQELALGMALALTGWLYFPVRQFLWRQLAHGALPDTRDVLPKLLEIATCGPSEARRANQLWRGLWDTLFQPLAAGEAPAGASPGIVAQGRGLVVAASPLPGLLLELPDRGGRLFNPADARQAEELCKLLQQALAAREAFERGAQQERRRIASDLHDDLGARLLSITHASAQAPRAQIAALARQALDEMRLAVRGLGAVAVPAAHALADWRAECVDRLDGAGLRVDWQAQEPPDGLVLSARVQLHGTRILREAVSNAIRHGGARSCGVRVDFEAATLRLEVSDDGQGLAPVPAGEAMRAGHGLASIERRARSLGGHHRIDSAPGAGLRLVVWLPLAPVADEAGAVSSARINA